jgi:hypothetical protein
MKGSREKRCMEKEWRMWRKRGVRRNKLRKSRK